MRIVVCLAALSGLLSVGSPIQRPGRPIPHPPAKVVHTGFRPVRGETVLELNIENRGEVFIDLETRLAPKATARIISLTNQGFYNGQRFFKVITSPRPYLVQVGDPQTRTLPISDTRLGSGGSGTKVPYEDTHIPYSSGCVVLATVDGDRDSGDCQFYILLGDYTRLLQGTGTVFGRVVVGLDKVSRIQVGDKVLTAQILTG
ncbi:MAG: peptidylprolyl isomerase [Fimbriimonadaceae bacterium]